MAADDDMTQFEDWDWVPMADSKVGIGFRWHRPPNCLKSAKILGNIGCF
jgi:hypothetical protein